MVAESHKNIQVFVRVRPHNQSELVEKQRTIIKVIDKNTLLFDPDDDEDEFFYQGIKQTHRDVTKRVKKKLSMEFDGVFHSEATNEDIFTQCTKPMVSSVMDGYNCSVFVYGATGAGKTFTMLGNESYPGITFLTMHELFDQIRMLSTTWKFDIGISYLEVYNEQVMNLLTKTGPLKLREDSNGVIVSGLILKPIYSAEELFDLLMQGNRNRTQHPTDANAESSRSHAIFQVHIRMVDKKSGQKRTVKLSMIDLAGSERAASTKGLGIRFKEGASINKSLLALGNCINKLADGLKHIPYRDSNLTRILKDSLGGICQTIMIANVSPSSLTYEDTYNTLKYASRAKKIRTTIKQNSLRVNMPKDYYVKRYCEQQGEIEQLKSTIKQLEAKHAEQTQSEDSGIASWYRKIDAVYGDVIKAQEHYLGKQSKEKILKYRTKLKGYAELRKRTMTLDGSHFVQDIARIEASIDRFEKQVVKQKDEMTRWRKRYHDALKDLSQLRKEIETANCSNTLAIYLGGKDWEVENSKNILKVNHIRKIYSLLHADSEYMEKIIMLSCEIIQNNYLLLRATGNLDLKQQENLNKLVAMIKGQRDIFIDGEYDYVDRDSKDPDLNLETITGLDEDILFKRKFSGSNNDNIDDYKNSKMFKPSDIEQLTRVLTEINGIKNDINTFTSPLSLQSSSLNETHIISDAKESTFILPHCLSANSMKKPLNLKTNAEILSSMLGENNAIGTNRALISKAFARSNIACENLLSKVAINKENKRFSPNRIRKSPKQVARTVMTRAISSAKNSVNRHKTNIETLQGNSGQVRVNRTTTMRLKK